MFYGGKVVRHPVDVLSLSDGGKVLMLQTFISYSNRLPSIHTIHSSITNLKYWGGSEPIISKTLTLLSDLSGGYSCVRKLVKLEEVQFMLTHHTVSGTII